MKVFHGIEQLEKAVGTHLGFSDWHTVTQEQIDRFAEATGDHQWIHVDPERAKGGPFGTTVAHGYLTLSLVPMLTWQVYTVQGPRMSVNYGSNKVRFPSPVSVGSRVRAGVELVQILSMCCRTIQSSLVQVRHLAWAPASPDIRYGPSISSKEMIMPLWNVYTPVGAFTADQKKEFAKDITAKYTETVGIPAFYVVVSFREVPEEDFLVGGEPVGNFIRIFVDHVARQLDTPELRKWARDEFEKALVPHVKDRGFDWEWHIDETPIDLWQVQGITPPPPLSEAERLWVKENRPVPYEASV